jgi:hypothetical protein
MRFGAQVMLIEMQSMLIEVLGVHPARKTAPVSPPRPVKEGLGTPFEGPVMLIEVHAPGCKPRQHWVSALASLYYYWLTRAQKFGLVEAPCPSAKVT